MTIEPTERESRCDSYLKGVIGNEYARNLGIKGWKDLVEIRDPEAFHSLAVALGIKELSTTGGPHYVMDVPGDRTGHWTVSLVSREDEFLQKYGSQYIT